MWGFAVAAAQQDPFVRLSAPEARASSFLRSNWNKFTENYHPNYVLDGDPATAWVEGIDGVGVGEWIGWNTSVVAGVHRVKLKVRNGYQKSTQLLAANAAPSVVTVALLRTGRVVHQQRFPLDRRMGWQELALDPPQDVAMDEVRLTVTEAAPGSVYADLCLSDVEVWVDAETPWSGPFERSKDLALQAWIADRKAAAAEFAQLPEAWPFTATHFEERGLEPRPDPAELRRLADEAKALVTTPPPSLRRADGRPPRLPDGLSFPTELRQWLATDLSFFEATDEWRSRSSDANGSIALDAIGNARVRLRADGAPEVAVFPHVLEFLGRSDARGTTDWVVWFDKDARPRTFVALERTESGVECTGQHRFAEVLDLERDATGRVKAVTQRSWTFCQHGWAEDWCHQDHPEGPERDRRCPSSESTWGFRWEARQ